MDRPLGISIPLPDWVWSTVDQLQPLSDLESQMDAVLDLARQNVADGGGPFAAGIFDPDGNLVGPGVNLVVPAAAPIAHAEIVAIAMAGQRLGRWDFSAAGGFRLVSTTEPCAMCLGAVPWSGVNSLVCGARDSDARTIGFDEGHKPADWVSHLDSTGIKVHQDVRRDEAVAVLRSYADGGGDIYNGGAAQ